ncbi:MAG: VWA domain-containing protein [Bacillota bacterium]|nr:VWA domain-containing protein [Bacillota bacterium]
MNFEIMRPYMLILIPILIAFALWSGRKLYKVNRKKKIILISRVIIFTLLALAAANITVRLNLKNTATLFLMDVSDSDKDFKSEGTKFISNAIENMPEGNKAGVVVFGENSLVEQFISKEKDFKEISSAPVSTATNLENAINSALSVFPQDTAKRIVLISDGEENEGDALKTISSLNGENVDLKVYKIEKKSTPEVYVDNVKIPDRINLGDQFSITATIVSNINTSAKLSLYSGRVKKSEQPVQIEKGKNTFVFKDIQDNEGFKGYKVVIEPDKDTELKNNEYTAFTNVTSKPKILLMEGNDGDGAELEKILQALNMDYKKISAKAAPRSINEMNEYKVIIAANNNIDDLNKDFVNNLESYVKDYAGGFIAVGGEDSFALGGYKDTPIEKVLPVNMDMKGKKEIPKMSLMLVIDHSGSMGEGGNVNKLELAKEAATRAVDTLRPEDEIGVLAFDDGYDWVVKRQNVKNKDDIKKSIGTIGVNGGTSIFPALEQAYEEQLKSNAKIKHIILLTDGQDGYRQYDDLIEDMKKHNITLSTVAVGTDADENMLQDLAKGGLGRYYHTDIYTDMPRIFAKEIMLSTKAYLNNREFAPKITSQHSILTGVLEEGKLPSLLGYVGASKKDNATMIMASDEDDPILTAWQFGLGKTAAWNSDMSGKWSANFVNWDKNLRLWQNIINWTVENYGSGQGNAAVNVAGNEAKIEYTTADISPDTKVKAVYSSDDGDKGELELEQTEPGKYSGKIKLSGTGFYNINVREEQNGKAKASQNAVAAMQYSPEYKFNGSEQVLENLVNETSGKFIKLPEDVFKGEIKNVASSTNLTNLFLILAMLLFIFDIANRRLRIDFLKLVGKTKFFRKLNTVKISKKPKKIRINDNKHEQVSSELLDSKVNMKFKEEESKPVIEKKKISKTKETKSSNEKIILDTSTLLKKKKDRE